MYYTARSGTREVTLHRNCSTPRSRLEAEAAHALKDLQDLIATPLDSRVGYRVMAELTRKWEVEKFEARWKALKLAVQYCDNWD